MKHSAVTILILFNGFLLRFAQTASNTSKQHMNARITKENNNEITNGNSIGETTQGKKINIRFSNEGTESNKGFTLGFIKQSTITMKVSQIALPSKRRKMPISP